MSYRVEMPPGAHRYDKACHCAYCTGYEKQLQKFAWQDEVGYRTRVWSSAVVPKADQANNKIIF